MLGSISAFPTGVRLLIVREELGIMKCLLATAGSENFAEL